MKRKTSMIMVYLQEKMQTGKPKVAIVSFNAGGSKHMKSLYANAERVSAHFAQYDILVLQEIASQELESADYFPITSMVYTLNESGTYKLEQAADLGFVYNQSTVELIDVKLVENCDNRVLYAIFEQKEINCQIHVVNVHFPLHDKDEFNQLVYNFVEGLVQTGELAILLVGDFNHSMQSMKESLEKHNIVSLQFGNTTPNESSCDTIFYAANYLACIEHENGFEMLKVDYYANTIRDFSNIEKFNQTELMLEHFPICASFIYK